MAENITKRFQDLRRELIDLAGSSEEAGRLLKGFIENFEKLGQLKGFKDTLGGIINYTNLLAKNLEAAGASSSAIGRIRQEFAELNVVLQSLRFPEFESLNRRLTRGVSQQWGDAPGQEGDPRPDFMSARRADLMVRAEQRAARAIANRPELAAEEQLSAIAEEHVRQKTAEAQAVANVVNALQRKLALQERILSLQREQVIVVTEEGQRAEDAIRAKIAQREFFESPEGRAEERLRTRANEFEWRKSRELSSAAWEPAQAERATREKLVAAGLSGTSSDTANQISSMVAINRAMQERFGINKRLAEIEKARQMTLDVEASHLEKILNLERRRVDKNQGLMDVIGPEGTSTPGGKVGLEQILGGKAVSDFAGTKGIDSLRGALAKMKIDTSGAAVASADLSDKLLKLNIQFPTVEGVTRRATIVMDQNANIVKRSSGAYRTFTESITRNIAKGLEWAIALSIVYAPIRLLNTAIKDMITLQTDLTDSIVAVGKAQADVRDIFDAAAEVADATGSSVQGVIKGYALAFAAAGTMANESQRAAVAQQLLTDSMILSELAGIEQATALDILVAALRQTGRSADQSTELIDSFVAVSRNANVSINTLASAFGIVGTAAEDAGISYEQLIALTATVAEATKLSADESGNAIRGFISGFQSAKSEEVLSRYGIAVRDAQGHVKGFMDLLRELSVLQSQGVLSEEAISEITNAVGGGFRRGAQFATTLDAVPLVMERTIIAENAQGEASAALAVKLDTVGTAVTRLGNAFQKFVMALGQEGGGLDLIEGLVNLVTSLVNAFADLTKALGPASTALLAFGGASLLLSRTNTGANILSGLSGMAGVQGLGRLGQPKGLNLLQLGMGMPQTPSGPLAKMGLGGAAMGLGVPAIVAGGAALEGDWEKAGASLAGAAIGGLIGSATIVGAPIGAAVGSIAASAFVDSLNVNIEALKDTFRKSLPTDAKGAIGRLSPEELSEKTDEELNDILERTINLGNQIAIFFTAMAEALPKEVTFEEARSLEIRRRAGELESTQMLRGRQVPTAQPLPQIVRDVLEELERRVTEEEVAAEKEKEKLLPTAFESAFLSNLEKATAVGGKVAGELLSDALDEFRTGEGSFGAVQGARELRGEAFGMQITKLSTALGLAGLEIDMETLGMVLSQLTDEERLFLVTMADDIGRASDAGEDFSKTGKDLVNIFGAMKERAAALKEEDVTSAFRDLRDSLIGVADIPDLQKRADAMTKVLQEQFPNLPLDPEETNLLLDDGFGTLHASSIVTNLLLQDILDVNRDQLEGIFNIPEGFVPGLPITGKVQFGGGGAGMPGGMEDWLMKLVELMMAEGSKAIPIVGAVGPSRVDRAAGDAARATRDAERRRVVEGFDRPTRAGIKGTGILSNKGTDFDMPGGQTHPAGADFGAVRGLFEGIFRDIISFIGKNQIDLGPAIDALLPESIPVNINQEITIQNTTFLDGQQIAQSLETRQYQEFATATRRAGAVGYERV